MKRSNELCYDPSVRASQVSALLFSIAVAVAGCGDDPTSLTIVVTSPIEAPAEIDGLRFQVVGESSGAMLDRSFTLASDWPHSVTVLPGSDPNENVAITVTGNRGGPSGSFLVDQTVMDRFVEGEERVIEVVLPRDCMFIRCGTGLNCVGGQCVSLMPDGGPPDATAGDAGDAGMGDAGPECTLPEDCDDGIECTVDQCTGGVCSNTPDDSVCEIGTTCDPVSGCPARPCTDDAECDDAMSCNGTETCSGGLCARGSAPDCSDGIDCTADSCDDAMGGCIHVTDDAACDDGLVCNGAELCSITSGCTAGDPPICDDMDDCTTGACVETAMMCVHTTRDADMDGHGTTACPAVGGVDADDCDDTDPAVFPGAVEICNGEDDNCDGSCDDAFTCCAGQTGTCTTSCGTTGSRTCSSACAWSVCSPPPEICNGTDDDCNGACDDGFACCQGQVQACTTSCGSTGTRTCDGGCNLGSCVAPFETCNGADDDCDMRVDEAACGACMDTPDCDDGNPCNGAETCERGGCSPGTPLVCSDGIACTVDSCDPAMGCIATPDDRFCADGNFCNGAEVCTATGCQPGTPPTCNDSDDCTNDACVGTAPGMCVQSTRDADRDGFGDTACSAAGGVPNTDCDDTRATVFPGAPELCNARDDDCDGMADETFTCERGVTGTCMTTCGTTGSRVCSSTCSWGLCAPPPEVCNGMDDDCNGMPDDGFTCAAGATRGCTTMCGSTGMQTCDSSCGWGVCTAPAESCNGLDDDCDGMVDDGFSCAMGATVSCSTSCGTTGLRTCDGTCNFGSCVPPAEACNGMDDDCDSMIDESVECTAGATGSCTTSCGSTGSRTCSAMCTWSTCTPPAEVCNAADDDCNGVPDNGFTCVRGTMGSCTTSCGSTGARTCGSTCDWGTCTPPAEVCNGADDDCDSVPDDGFACVQGATGSCTTSCGSTGTRTCSSGCTWGTCSAPAETCNGSDDDCDGLVDETFTCVPGATGSCTASCGTTGTRTCTSSCTWGTCNPPAEACNGLDDDCDSMCDDGFTCCRGSSGSCTTSCGTTGTRTCSSSCGWSACSPPGETCNGVDDDCNTVCDDGFACCAGSTGTCTTSCGSTGTRTCSSGCAWGTCNAPAETCNGADDDCDGTCDDGFACCRGTVTSCTTSCGSTGTRTCGSSCTLGSCTAPAESCNGVDDDCDGMVDEGCGGCGSCTGATTVNAPGGRYTATLRPHAQNGTGACNGGTGSEAYLTFTLTATSDVFVTTHNSGIDTVLYVRDCSCTGPQRACNDNADGYNSSALRMRDLPAGTYNIIADTRAAMSGSIDVDVYITTPGPDGDRCGDALPIPAGSANLTGNTCSFTNDYQPQPVDGCLSGSGAFLDQVFYFYVPSSRTVTFNGCGSGMNYDSTIYVRTVCNDSTAGAQAACNEDGSGCSGMRAFCNTGYYNSSLTTTLGPGLYYFFTDGWSTSATCSCGPYSYSISGI